MTSEIMFPTSSFGAVDLSL